MKERWDNLYFYQYSTKNYQIGRNSQTTDNLPKTTKLVEKYINDDNLPMFIRFVENENSQKSS